MSDSTGTRQFIAQLVEQAAGPYRAAGRFAWHFARGKLGGDPVFAGLLEHGVLADKASILDIGCGQGLLAAWLLAAREAQKNGTWPAQWAAAPQPQSLRGIDLLPRDVERARTALGTAAAFTLADMRDADFGTADAVVLLDVLHYVDAEAQENVLRRACAALTPSGALILRVGDAGRGWRFRFGMLIDHAVSLARGNRKVRLHGRSLPEWMALLRRLGMQTRALPMHAGTPFANMLLVAQHDSRTTMRAAQFDKISP